MMVNGTEDRVGGMERDLKCCECNAQIEFLAEEFTCCQICDSLVHAKCTECYRNHMQTHATDHFYTGLRLREERMAAAREEQRAKETAYDDQDRAALFGSLPPRPGVVRDNSQSCAPVDADAVAIPGPEIGTEDAMEAFWRERPTLSTSDVDKLRKELRREAASDQRRRYCCLLYTSPSPRDGLLSRMPSSA